MRYLYQDSRGFFIQKTMKDFVMNNKNPAKKNSLYFIMRDLHRKYAQETLKTPANFVSLLKYFNIKLLKKRTVSKTVTRLRHLPKILRTYHLKLKNRKQKRFHIMNTYIRKSRLKRKQNKMVQKKVSKIFLRAHFRLNLIFKRMLFRQTTTINGCAKLAKVSRKKVSKKKGSQKHKKKTKKANLTSAKENLQKFKQKKVKKPLYKNLLKTMRSPKDYSTAFMILQNQYPIHNKNLLPKSVRYAKHKYRLHILKKYLINVKKQQQTMRNRLRKTILNSLKKKRRLKKFLKKRLKHKLKKKKKKRRMWFKRRDLRDMREIRRTNKKKAKKTKRRKKLKYAKKSILFFKGKGILKKVRLLKRYKRLTFTKKLFKNYRKWYRKRKAKKMKKISIRSFVKKKKKYLNKRFNLLNKSLRERTHKKKYIYTKRNSKEVLKPLRSLLKTKKGYALALYKMKNLVKHKSKKIKVIRKSSKTTFASIFRKKNLNKNSKVKQIKKTPKVMKKSTRVQNKTTSTYDKYKKTIFKNFKKENLHKKKRKLWKKLIRKIKKKRKKIRKISTRTLKLVVKRSPIRRKRVKRSLAMFYGKNHFRKWRKKYNRWYKQQQKEQLDNFAYKMGIGFPSKKMLKKIKRPKKSAVSMLKKIKRPKKSAASMLLIKGFYKLQKYRKLSIKLKRTRRRFLSKFPLKYKAIAWLKLKHSRKIKARIRKTYKNKRKTNFIRKFKNKLFRTHKHYRIINSVGKPLRNLKHLRLPIVKKSKPFKLNRLNKKLQRKKKKQINNKKKHKKKSISRKYFQKNSKSKIQKKENRSSYYKMLLRRNFMRNMFKFRKSRALRIKKFKAKTLYKKFGYLLTRNTFRFKKRKKKATILYLKQVFLRQRKNSQQKKLHKSLKNLKLNQKPSKKYKIKLKTNLLILKQLQKGKQQPSFKQYKRKKLTFKYKSLYKRRKYSLLKKNKKNIFIKKRSIVYKHKTSTIKQTKKSKRQRLIAIINSNLKANNTKTSNNVSKFKVHTKRKYKVTKVIPKMGLKTTVQKSLKKLKGMKPIRAIKKIKQKVIKLLKKRNIAFRKKNFMKKINKKTKYLRKKIKGKFTSIKITKNILLKNTKKNYVKKHLYLLKKQKLHINHLKLLPLIVQKKNKILNIKPKMPYNGQFRKLQRMHRFKEIVYKRKRIGLASTYIYQKIHKASKIINIKKKIGKIFIKNTRSLSRIFANRKEKRKNKILKKLTKNPKHSKFGNRKYFFFNKRNNIRVRQKKNIKHNFRTYKQKKYIYNKGNKKKKNNKIFVPFVNLRKKKKTLTKKNFKRILRLIVKVKKKHREFLLQKKRIKKNLNLFIKNLRENKSKQIKRHEKKAKKIKKKKAQTKNVSSKKNNKQKLRKQIFVKLKKRRLKKKIYLYNLLLKKKIIKKLKNRKPTIKFLRTQRYYKYKHFRRKKKYYKKNLKNNHKKPLKKLKKKINKNQQKKKKSYLDFTNNTIYKQSITALSNKRKARSLKNSYLKPTPQNRYVNSRTSKKRARLLVYQLLTKKKLEKDKKNSLKYSKTKKTLKKKQKQLTYKNIKRFLKIYKNIKKKRKIYHKILYLKNQNLNAIPLNIKVLKKYTKIYKKKLNQHFQKYHKQLKFQRQPQNINKYKKKKVNIYKFKKEYSKNTLKTFYKHKRKQKAITKKLKMRKDFIINIRTNTLLKYRSLKTKLLKNKKRRTRKVSKQSKQKKQLKKKTKKVSKRKKQWKKIYKQRKQLKKNIIKMFNTLEKKKRKSKKANTYYSGGLSHRISNKHPYRITYLTKNIKIRNITPIYSHFKYNKVKRIKKTKLKRLITKKKKLFKKYRTKRKYNMKKKKQRKELKMRIKNKLKKMKNEKKKNRKKKPIITKRRRYKKRKSIRLNYKRRKAKKYHIIYDTKEKIFNNIIKSIFLLKFLLRIKKTYNEFGRKQYQIFLNALIIIGISALIKLLPKAKMITHKLIVYLHYIYIQQYKLRITFYKFFKEIFRERFFTLKAMSLVISGTASSLIASFRQAPEINKVLVRFFALHNRNVDANFVLNYILKKLSQYFSTDSIIRPLTAHLKRIRALLGYRIIVAGRLTRKERAAYMLFQWRLLPPSTIRLNIDYAMGALPLRFGVASVRVYLLRKRQLPYYYFMEFRNQKFV